MQKFLFVFTLTFLFVCNVFSNDIENLNAYESAPGIITFTWNSDTTNINKFIFSICKFDSENSILRKFVNLVNQDANNFINDGYFTCSSDIVILNGTKSNSNANIYDECVNEDGTLNPGSYIINVIGINKNGTYNREFQSNEVNVIGKNYTTDNINNNLKSNVIKYLYKNQIYIIRNNKIYDIYGKIIKINLIKI